MRLSWLRSTLAIALAGGWLLACASAPHGAPPAVHVAAEDPCAADAAQSPIAIDPRQAQASQLEAPSFHYRPAAVVLWNKGKTVQADYAAGLSPGDQAGNYILLDGVRFDLLEFHFHHPVEHPIAGADFSPVMELHLVHADARGNLAAVGLPIVIGGGNTSTLDALMAAIPREKGWRALLPAPFDAKGLQPPAAAPAFRYPGSLTTPLYRECVRWTVYTQPLGISKASFDAYKDRFKVPYARAPQEPNGRVLLRARP